MRAAALVGNHGVMNDTQEVPQSGQPAGPDDEFEPRRLRTIADMERSSDDRIVAGVCAGAAKYLNIDPIIIRVVLAVLTIAGFAGVILYVAAWVLLPSDDAEKSLAADWFKLDKNEEQVRVTGLVGAVILAALSIVGDSSWAWWGDATWWLVPIGLLFWLFWVRPRQRRQQRRQPVPDPATAPDFAETKKLQVTERKIKKSRERWSPALLILTTSLTAIAFAATLIYDQVEKDVPWTMYVAVALAVVGAGLLVGTFFGNSGPLIGVGIVLAVALAIGSAVPSGRIGSQTPTPTVAADARAHYRHGVGQLDIDLTAVSDPERLLGRTITIDAGIGQTTVTVPAGLNVDVSADVDAGQISLFGRDDDGTDVSMIDTADRPAEPALTIEIDQKLGQIEVIRR